MMATELMIGDYIMFNNDIYIIEEISKKGWAHLIYNDGSNCRVALSSDYILGELTPVPLTPEILEKNGFKECTNGDWTNDNVDFILYRRKDGIFRIQNTNITLPYVSSFQHALRLCNINKEVKI